MMDLAILNSPDATAAPAAPMAPIDLPMIDTTR